jgi:hypothetical protein
MTTDNPRELRISAQRCLECDEPLRRRIDALAEYVLATVRDDDGEEQPDTAVEFGNVDDLTIKVDWSGVWLWIGDDEDVVEMCARRPTRRQFRDLCRGLGIEVTG